MKLNLAIHLNIDGNRITKRGEFTVWKEEDIPKLAHDWVRYTKNETGHRKTEIEKIVWNNEHDITDKVRQLDNAPIPDIDLPF